MKRTLIVVAGLLAVSTWVFGATAPAEPKKYETKMGTVTFEHKKHEALKCEECHHTGEQKACSSCHGTEAKDKMVKLYDAIHSKTASHSCAACHAKAVEAGKKAPKDCKGCHIKS